MRTPAPPIFPPSPRVAFRVQADALEIEAQAKRALAHVIGDKAQQAYRRSDALDKRRKVMEAWAAYCEPKASGNVVQISKRKTL